MRCIAYALGLAALCGTAAPAATPPRFVVKPGKVLNFGRVAVGKGKSKWIQIRNAGAGIVNVTWDAHPSQEFEAHYSGVGLDARRTFKWKFSFVPTDKGHFEAPLTFTTDDPQRPEVTITLRGQGYFRNRR